MDQPKMVITYSLSVIVMLHINMAAIVFGGVILLLQVNCDVAYKYGCYRVWWSYFTTSSNMYIKISF
jgi:hypothetical protein